MISLIIGLAFLILQFSFIFKFEDSRKGFFYLSGILFAFYLFSSFILQLFGLFNYPIFFSFNLFFTVALFFFFRGKYNFKKIDWIFLLLVVFLFVGFYQVHYNFDGVVTTLTTGYQSVESFSYSYPYFSDEWANVALSDYSLKSGGLASVNPLWPQDSFLDLEVAFHSFSSGIFLFLGLNPLTDYVKVGLFFSLFNCILFYFLLRSFKVDKIYSGVSTFLFSLILNGANLPGLWYFIPITLGISSFLISLYFLNENDLKKSILSSVLILFFYPPLFVFYLPLILFYAYENKNLKKNMSKFLGICVFVFLLLLVPIFIHGQSNFISYIWGKLFYGTFTSGAIPHFSFWRIIPLVSLFFFPFGFYSLYLKKKWLLAPLVVGVIYWVLYSFVFWRFIIEYERLVYFTSFYVVFISGIGISYLDGSLLKSFSNYKKYFKIVLIILFVLLAFNSFRFERTSDWKSLKLYSVNGDVFDPASPVNSYLVDDDLRIFANISGEKFLAPPWKGLVIGVATGNYPLETKPATVTVRKYPYLQFMNLDCYEKTIVANNFGLKYVYSVPFECENFKLVDSSREGFGLYLVK